MGSHSQNVSQPHWLLTPENWWKTYLIGWLPVGAAYLMILGLFVSIDGLTLITTWVANIIVPIIIGIGASWLILRVLHTLSWSIQLVLHAFGSLIFSTLWAQGTFRLMQIFSGLMTGDWTAPQWPAPVMAWQLFQGVAIYFTLCSATYAYWALQKLSAQSQTVTEPSDSTRIFAKKDDIILPIDVAEITAVQTIEGTTFIFRHREKLESRISLSALESHLPGESFLRVHRSAIINIDHIQSIEAVGNGRMAIHMKNDETVLSSRAGTTAIKSRLSIV